MDFINRLQTQLSAFWEQLDPRRRWTLGITLVALMAGFTALLLWANQTDYAPLYTNISPEVAPEIVEKLKERKVEYRLSHGGSVIEVPRSQVLDIRLGLAGEGIPRKGTVGFEIFDNPSVSTTSFVEQLNYQRALQGELQRTINDMELIESSRVLLAIPRESLFIEDNRPPTASVVLKLQDASQVRRQHIKAITNLVASAIEGMSPEDVTVTDTNGKLLSTPRDDDSGGVPSSILEYKETLERKMEARVVELLEQTTGPGKVRAMVTADLDLSSQEEIQERFDPDSQVARSVQRRTEDRDATIPGPEGAPGTDANLPALAAAAAARVQRNQVGKIDETTNFEIDKTTRKIIERPGQLSRLSVTVLVDGTLVEGESGKQWQPRTTEEQAALGAAVKAAIGFDESRGDVVEIVNVPFHSLEDELTSSTQLEWQSPARYGLMLLGMVLLFFLTRPIINALTAERPLGDPDAEAEMLGEGGRMMLDAAYADGGYGDGSEPLSLADGQRLLTAGNADRQRREEMINLARSDMENTVNTLREWMQEQARKSA